MGPVALPNQATALTGSDIWRVLRSNMWLILGAAILGGGIGGGVYAYLKQTHPKYRSVGYVVVNKPFRVSPTGKQTADDVSDIDFNLPIEQKTQTQMLLSEALWNDVIEKNTQVRDTDWYKNFENESSKKNSGVTPVRLAKEDLDDNLRVSPIPDSKLIQISMDCAKPDDARDIVKNLVDAHIDNQRQLNYDRTSQELESAKLWQDRYVKLEAQTKEKMNSLQAGNATPVAMGRMSIKELEISQLIGAQTKARMDAQEASGALDAINQQVADGKDPSDVDMFVRNDPSVVRLQSMVDDFDMRIQSLEQTSGAKSRMANDLKVQREVARQKLDKATANARSMARDQLIAKAKSDFAAKKAEADSIDARVEALRTELGEISAQMAEYSSLKDELDGYKELEREQSDRVSMLRNAAQQQVASVNWSSMPTTPDTLSSPNAKIILPLSVMLGVALSLGIAFLREIADTSVRSPRDISRVGPMNLLGMVSCTSDDNQLTGVPLHLAISQAPHSMIAEQMRQVRTRLQHAAALDTTRTIAITSPGPGDGKSTIACNLAAGLALNGRRILLVDANFRKPELHKLFGVANDAGLSGVLESVATLEAVTHKTQIPNLELLAAGPRPTNPTELFEGPLFNDFIDRALEEYDHVIFDAGPLLVVSEAVALAPRVDGVITVVRAKKNTRGMLSRVRETLKQIKAENLGVVLNGVKALGGGYYGRTIKTYYAYQNAE